jgi:hypothetical protein
MLHSPNLKKRFEEKFQVTPSCWVWQATKTAQGYGQFGLKRKMTVAHRVSYLLYKGAIPAGLMVLHNCHNPSCVNPEHLRLGTNAENMKDRQQCGTTYAPTGEDHHNALFTNAQAQEIRKLYAAGGLSHQKLALQYSCSKSVITDILTGKRYGSRPTTRLYLA